jgi:hypothetical protein
MNRETPARSDKEKSNGGAEKSHASASAPASAPFVHVEQNRDWTASANSSATTPTIALRDLEKRPAANDEGSATAGGLGSPGGFSENGAAHSSYAGAVPTHVPATPEAKAETRTPFKMRDAIVFLPGLGEGSPLASFEAMARRIAAACDKQAQTGESTFEVREMRQERQKSGMTEVATLVRKDGHKEAVIADLYLLDYTRFHEQERTRISAATHVLRAVGLGFSISLRLLHSLVFSRALKLWHKVQLALAAAVGGAIALFIALILAMAFSHILQTGSYIGKASVSLIDWGVAWLMSSHAVGETTKFAWPQLPPYPTSSGQIFKTIPIDFHIVSRLLEGLIVIAAALSLLIKNDIKRGMTRLCEKVNFTARYVQTGIDQGPLVGQLSALLESIVEKGPKGTPYRQVHLFAQGFGSLLAIDALFPRSVPELRYRSVASLVTIGCPFDLVRAIWPDYYIHRQSLGETPATWLNVYHPDDILASDFSDKAGADRTPNGVELTNLKVRWPRNLIIGAETFSTLHRLSLVGFRLQKRYWNGDHDFDRNCWDAVVRELYKNDDMLA